MKKKAFLIIMLAVIICCFSACSSAQAVDSGNAQAGASSSQQSAHCEAAENQQGADVSSEGGSADNSVQFDGEEKTTQIGRAHV